MVKEMRTNLRSNFTNFEMSSDMTRYAFLKVLCESIYNYFYLWQTIYVTSCTAAMYDYWIQLCIKSNKYIHIRIASTTLLLLFQTIQNIHGYYPYVTVQAKISRVCTWQYFKKYCFEYVQKPDLTLVLGSFVKQYNTQLSTCFYIANLLNH